MYLPKTNTPLLHDGSAEARAIITSAIETVVADPDCLRTDVVLADGILYHALDYLKGKAVPLAGMWTKEFWGDEYTDLDNCEVCNGERGGVPGNENSINGVVVCDYCTADMMSGLIDYPEYLGELPLKYEATPRRFDSSKPNAANTPKELIQIEPAKEGCEPTSAT